MKVSSSDPKSVSRTLQGWLAEVIFTFLSIFRARGQPLLRIAMDGARFEDQNLLLGDLEGSVCVCVCVCERERLLGGGRYSISICMCVGL